MNNIGVFGDSFAHRHYPHIRASIDTGEKFHQDEGKEDFLREFPTFMEYIRDDNNSVKTHGFPGTDLLWSFVQFEKYHELYDTIIFILTSDGRITINYDWGEYHNNISDLSKPLTTSNIASCKHAKATFANDSSAKGVELYHIYSGLEKWHELCATDGFLEREWIIYNLVIDRIKQIRPDVKLIRAFSDVPEFWVPPDDGPVKRETNYRRVIKGVSLSDIMHIEDNIMNYTPPAQVPYADARQCHLTSESHKILAGQIKKWLKTDELYLNIDLREFEGINPDVKKYFVSKHASVTNWLTYNNIIL